MNKYESQVLHNKQPRYKMDELKKVAEGIKSGGSNSRVKEDLA